MLMHASEENGMANEAIVLHWPVWSPSWVLKSKGLVHCSVQMLLFWAKTIWLWKS